MKTKKIIPITVFLIIGLIALFYYFIAFKWGEGMSEVSKEYIKVQQDLADSIPTMVDTIYEEVKTIIQEQK